MPYSISKALQCFVLFAVSSATDDDIMTQGFLCFENMKHDSREYTTWSKKGFEDFIFRKC